MHHCRTRVHKHSHGCTHTCTPRCTRALTHAHTRALAKLYTRTESVRERGHTRNHRRPRTRTCVIPAQTSRHLQANARTSQRLRPLAKRSTNTQGFASPDMHTTCMHTWSCTGTTHTRADDTHVHTHPTSAQDKCAGSSTQQLTHAHAIAIMKRARAHTLPHARSHTGVGETVCPGGHEFRSRPAH